MLLICQQDIKIFNAFNKILGTSTSQQPLEKIQWPLLPSLTACRWQGQKGGGTLRHRSLVIAEGKLQRQKGKPILHGGTSRMTLRIAAGKDKRAAGPCDTGALSLPKANCKVKRASRFCPA
jgi:hypothetical protein